MHNLDFTKKNKRKEIYGLKINYSLFYKYDDFINELRSGFILTKGVNAENKLKSKEHLFLGIEFIYFMKNNPYMSSVTCKTLFCKNAIKLHKNYSFKKYCDFYDRLDLAVNLSVNIF